MNSSFSSQYQDRKTEFPSNCAWQSGWDLSLQLLQELKPGIQSSFGGLHQTSKFLPSLPHNGAFRSLYPYLGVFFFFTFYFLGRWSRAFPLYPKIPITFGTTILNLCFLQIRTQLSGLWVVLPSPHKIWVWKSGKFEWLGKLEDGGREGSSALATAVNKF